MKMSALSRLVKKFIKTKDATPARTETCHSCSKVLVAEKAGEHTLLHCPACQGTWLSAASLGSAVCQSQPCQELLAVVRDDSEAEIGHTFAPSRVARSCPACAKPMDNHKFEESGVWIDTCPEGHGIWLDRGELKLLTERAANPVAARPDDKLEDAFEDIVSNLLLSSL